ncbi:MAG: cytochrome d ubiquinol oxidase subunit II [Myxococcota bacterium]|jgi:cytochrome d ubiquinol oxidase subunit II
MTLALAICAVILGALAIYSLTGGADFGGGVWDLLASGPRKKEQRALIAHAIAPIWEANHVWLILIVVLLFVCFPAAFAAVSIALHIPLMLMLVGIVIRGTAFTFRAYGEPSAREETILGRAFALSSVFTPPMLGVCLGAVVSGAIDVDSAGVVAGGFLSSWLAPFPFAVGLFVLILFAYLAAVYLAVEAGPGALADDFRIRALISGIALGPVAFGVWMLAETGAVALHEAIGDGPLAITLQVLTGLLALGALGALIKRRLRLARILAAGQTVLIVAGLGMSMYPFILVDDLRISEAAAPNSVLLPVLIALACGLVVLIPSFLLLYRLFSRPRGAVSDAE